MYRTILVPLDGSSLAERALPVARALAERSSARLVLVRVAPSASFPDRPDEATREKALDDADAYLSGLVPRPLGDTSIETASYYGQVPSRIIEEVRAREADLVVMATHGRAGVDEWVHGSVATNVFRHAGCPVLVIPPGCEQTWPLSGPTHVLLPLDGSDYSRAALQAAVDLTRVIGAKLTVMRVVAPTSYIRVSGYPDPVGVQTEGISASDAEVYLNEVIADLRAQEPGIATYITEGTDVATAIALAARDQPTAAIVMATHGRGGLAHLVLGSVATGVVHQATTPILLVRPKGLT